jgi:predicted dehydrogenase
MQMNSGTGIREVQKTATPDRMGIVSAIMSHHYRNAPYGGWRRDIPSDCDADHVDWESFQGEAKRRPFDAQRFWNWRFYWDYSGGNVFENMVHPVGFWYQVLGLSIPEAVTMTGGNYRCPDMQVPDTMTVTMNHREKVLFTWNSMFGNAYFGEGHDYLLGSQGTIMHDESDRVIYLSEAQRAAVAGEGALLSAKAQGAEGYQDWTPRHFQNFFDCMRTRKDPICPFDLGFRTAIACQMAVASYRNQRTVRWDPSTETIV